MNDSPEYVSGYLVRYVKGLATRLHDPILARAGMALAMAAKHHAQARDLTERVAELEAQLAARGQIG